MGMRWLRQRLNKSKKPGSHLSPWTIFIIVISMLIEIGLILAILYILRTQGATQAVSILSTVAGVGALLGVAPALLLAYLQWHEPRTPKTPEINNVIPPNQAQPSIPATLPHLTPLPTNVTSPTHVQIFISYNRADSKKAKWIEEVLNQAGYATILGMDIPGTNPVIETDEALKAVKHTIVVISPDYLKENPEVWPNVFRTDKSSRQRALLPVYVRDSSQFLEKGFLGGITGIDLVGKNDDQAREDLIEGIRLSVDGLRKTPTIPPSFPGSP